MAIGKTLKEIQALKRREKGLNSDRRKAVERERRASFDFIADSRKTLMKCSCGMSDEVWSLSGLIISIAKAEWKRRHKKCEGNGVEFFDR